MIRADTSRNVHGYLFCPPLSGSLSVKICVKGSFLLFFSVLSVEAHLSKSAKMKSMLPRIAIRSAIMSPFAIFGTIWRCGNEGVRIRVR